MSSVCSDVTYGKQLLAKYYHVNVRVMLKGLGTRLARLQMDEMPDYNLCRFARSTLVLCA